MHVYFVIYKLFNGPTEVMRTTTAILDYLTPIGA